MASNVYRGILKGRIGGVVQTRNMFIAEVTLSEGDTIWDVWEGYITEIMTDVQPILATVWAGESFEIQMKETDGKWTSQEEHTLTFAGTATGEGLANFVSLVLIGRAYGRRRLSRKFFGPLAESTASENLVTNPAMVYAGQALIHWISPYTTTNSSLLSPGFIDKGGAFRPFVGGSVSQLLGTMRRRKPGLGI